MNARRNELRCFCARRPLLALCGWDNARRAPVVHVKVHKQGRIYGEVVASGEVHVRCRECLRWHVVRVVRDRPSLVETSEPIALSPHS